MHSATFLSTFCVALFAISSSALLAVPSQQCAGICGNVTETTGSDIVCSNSDLDNTPKGQALKKCLDCQLNSTASDPNTGETDTRWLLYNARYTLSSCLWSFPNTSYSLQANPCLTNPACGLYQGNIEYDNLSSTVGAYDYCDGFSARTTLQQPKCQACLQQLSDDSYLSNMFIVLVAGCQQKPNPGALLSIQGTTLFSTNAINITTPAATSVPAASSSHTSGSLHLGAIVGAAIAGVAVFLVLCGFGIIWSGKRRRRADLADRVKRQAEYNGFGARAPLGGHAQPKWTADLTPGGASSIGISPVSPGGSHFSPYASQYSSPVSAQDMINLNQTWDWKTPHSLPLGPQKTTSPGGSGLGISTRLGFGEQNQAQAIEMERIRDLRLAERKLRDEKVHQDFMREASERGFTTSPIMITSPTPTKGHFNNN